MKKQTAAAIALLAASFVLAVVSYLLLPATVITQLALSGSASTMPKMFAVALPTILGVGGAIVSIIGKNANNKPLIVSCIGVLLFIIMLVINL